MQKIKLSLENKPSIRKQSYDYVNYSQKADSTKHSFGINPEIQSNFKNLFIEKNQNQNLINPRIIRKCQQNNLNLFNQEYLIKQDQKLQRKLNLNKINIEKNNRKEQFLNQKKIKNLEILMNIEKEELRFNLKIKGGILLQQFGYVKNQYNQLNDAKSETQIFDFICNKLRQKLKEIKLKEVTSRQQKQKQKLIVLQFQENIRFLTQENQILKHSYNNLKQKQQQLKKEWNSNLQKVNGLEKQLEKKDLQIFKLKKLEQQNLMLKLGCYIKFTQKNNSNLKQKLEIQKKMIQIQGINKQFMEQYKNFKDHTEPLLQQLQYFKSQLYNKGISFNPQLHQIKLINSFNQTKNQYQQKILKLQSQNCGLKDELSRLTYKFIKINKNMEKLYKDKNIIIQEVQEP